MVCDKIQPPHPKVGVPERGGGGTLVTMLCGDKRLIMVVVRGERVNRRARHSLNKSSERN